MEAQERAAVKGWILFLAGILCVLFLFVAIKLFKLHLIEPQAVDYKQPDYSATYELLGLRGRILDRNGSVLAESVPGRVIYIDRRDPKLNHKEIDRTTLARDIS
jgi:cell division protein FtsI/penicillin-binding protein 2